MSYLIDTNVISELRKRERTNPLVLDWFQRRQPQEIFLSVLTLGELRRGVERVRRRDPGAAFALGRWLDQILDRFGDRILDVDRTIAEHWGRIGIPNPLPDVDALIAATERRGVRPEWFFDRRLSAGPVLDLLIHDIDIVRWITGLEYRSVSGTEGNIGRPDDPHYHNAGQMLFRLDGGVSAVMEHHRLVPPSLGRMDNRLKILGTQGQAEITHDNRVWLYRWDESAELIDLPDQRDIFSNFVRTACAGHAPIVSTQDAVQSMQAALCATEAGFSGTQQQVPSAPDLPARTGSNS